MSSCRRRLASRASGLMPFPCSSACMSMPTAISSRGRTSSDGQAAQQQGLVPRPAGVRGRRLLGHPAADDGGELFGSGHVRQQPVLLGRHLLVCSTSSDSERFLEALWRKLLFSAIILAIEIPLGMLVALCMPRKGWGVVGHARPDGAAAADPVERRRHDLAGVRARRYRPARLHAEQRSASTTTT